MLLFFGTGLISVAAQYNIRENAAGAVVVSLQNEGTLERDASSHLRVLNGPQSLQFVAMVDHPGDSTVDKWDLDSDDADVRRDVHDQKLEIDPKAGILKSSLPAGTRGKILKVIAFSHWNHAWQGVYLLQLGSAPVQVASTNVPVK